MTAEKQRRLVLSDLPELPEGLLIRPMTPHDIPEVEVIEHSIFSQESPWSAQEFAVELGYPYSYYLVLENTSESPATIAGYSGLVQLGDSSDLEYEIRTVALDPSYQGQGLGKSLLGASMTIVDSHPGPVFLEVRTDNDPARGLYETFGFFTTGVRKNYYQPSGADAFTMMRPPAQQD